MRIRHDSERADELFRVGLEIEAFLLDSKGLPVNAGPLIREFGEITKHTLDYEYGVCQFEYRTLPTPLEKLMDLNLELQEFIECLDKAIHKVYKDVIPVFLGGNPSPEIFKNSLITNKPRYDKLASLQRKIPDAEIDGVKFKAERIATAIQGFHIHLQGQSPTHTAKMFNHILNLIPSAIVLGANSRLIAGKIFSQYEPRILLYDQSEQQNSGFPTITRYLDGIEDYIDYIISREPNIAKDYFELEKERHDDVRIRLNSDFYRVETRVMSVQPTPSALMAIIEFFIGYLYKAIHQERQLRPLPALREERLGVVKSGYDAVTHFNILKTIEGQLDFARKGLEDLGVKPKFLSILNKRLENKNSPGQYVANLWEKKFNGSVEQTIAEITYEIWQRTKENRPIT